ncbi:MAG TPA: TIGR03435 family protein [Terracidiphilus sp.]
MTISQLWHASWNAPLFNHLWQSTLILAIAWLLVLVLRRNPARVRYAIWMLASLKFLIPFALLSNLGARWARPIPGKLVASGLYTTADQISQPFQPDFARAAGPVHAHSADWLAFVPVVLAAIWFCGFVAVLFTWIVRWRRMARIAKGAASIDAGRELQALRRAEATAGIRRPVPLCASSHAIEPGVFGICRPILLWPAGISAQLDDAQVASIVAHEVEHVRRRDNFTAAIHMLVEALFWFHPAVHWMGSQLMEERERACDEKVLELTAQPESYAESILKVCAFCLEPAVPCVSGVSGSDLKQRILRIMTQPSGVALGAVRKSALCAAAVLAVAIPLGFGVLHAMQAPTELVHPAAGSAPAFEVVSIKPNHDDGRRRRIGISPTGFTATHASLKDIIGMAYDTTGAGQIIGGPDWMNSEYFDIEAKASEADIEAGRKLTMDQRRKQLSLMLQSMLSDRFGLRTAFETRELPVYALTVARSGAKIQQVQVYPVPADGTPPPPGAHVTSLTTHDARDWTATAFPMDEFTHWLSHFEELDKRIVVNETGLTGNYDFVLRGVSMGSELEMKRDPGQEAPTSIFTALQEQLGLKLESRKAPVEVVVIEQAERPSPN